MKCNTCGNDVREEAVYCPNCGERPTAPKKVIKKDSSTDTNKVTTTTEKKEKVGEADYSFLWGLLGYFIPIVGLILFIVWRESKPKAAKAVGIGALIRAILMFIAFIIMIVLVVISGLSN